MSRPPRAPAQSAIELLRWPEPFDALLVPLGNGALLAGIARWVKARVARLHQRAIRASSAPLPSGSGACRAVPASAQMDAECAGALGGRGIAAVLDKARAGLGRKCARGQLAAWNTAPASRTSAPSARIRWMLSGFALTAAKTVSDSPRFRRQRPCPGRSYQALAHTSRGCPSSIAARYSAPRPLNRGWGGVLRL